MGDTVVDELRRLGRSLETAHPGLGHVRPLREDPALAAGAALVPELDRERLARLIGNELPGVVALVAAGAARAAGLEQAAAEAACNQLEDASPGVAVLLLEALAVSPPPWVLGAVLTIAESDWIADDRRAALFAFAAARAEAGETLLEDEIRGADPHVLDHVLSDAPAVVADRYGALLSRRASPGGVPDPDPEPDPDPVEPPAGIGRPVDLRGPGPTAYPSRTAATEAVIRALTATPARSVLLVGEPGSGRTTVARAALAAAGRRAFEASAADVNAGMKYVGELEQRVGELVAALRDGPAWLLPGLEGALWAGQHERSRSGLLDALLGPVRRGEICVVSVVEPAAFALLRRERPAIETAFEVVRVPPAGPAEAIAVARDWLAAAGVEASAQTVERAQELADAYLGRTAAPGRLVTLLRQATERAARSGAGGLTVDGLLATLSDTTGVPADLLDPGVPMDVAAERAALAAQVLGQPEAVEALVQRLALVKAGVTDPTRPLGVLLFVGPTGTGKTELAKALARRLFGDADRLVRLDMSEFQTAESVERVLADAAADGHGSPLIGAVRAQPFSVVLLDEFEKAHPRVWDLFLALFDDGRLTDARGHVTDFRQCVVIVTSNVGSALPTGRGLGFAGDDGGAAPAPAGGVERALARTFRPELLNRFDRIVTFRPLGRDVMRALLESELAGVLRRRGLRVQPWAVEWDAAALDLLLERGFSAALGARPLRRAVERFLLVPLAEAIVGRAVPEGDQFLFVGVRDGEIDVRFVDPDAEDGAPAEPPAAPAEGDDLAGVRALAAEPDAGPAARGLLGAVLADVQARVDGWGPAKDAALARMREPGFWDDAADRDAVLERVELLDRLEAATATAGRLSSRLGARAANVAGLLAVRLHVLDAALRGLDAGAPARVTVTVTPSPGTGEAGEAWAHELRAMYRAWADARGARMDPDGTCDGLGAAVLLGPEAGLHVLERPGGRSGFDRIGATVAVGADAPAEIVRRYRLDPSPLVRDARTGARTGRLDRVLGGGFDLL